MRRILATGALLMVLAGCSLGEPIGIRPAFQEVLPEGADVVAACRLLVDLPSGDPLAGVAVGADRQAAFQAALSGAPVDVAGLRHKYDALLARMSSFADAMTRASEALGAETPNPVDVAQFDWRYALTALEEQVALTFELLRMLDARPDADGTDPSAASLEGYRTAARDWADGQRVVEIALQQLEWSHNRAMAALEPTCGPLPTFAVPTPAG